MNQINVMMGKVGIGFHESELVSLGLGSCVAVSIYEPGKKVAALGHVVLPSNDENKISLDNSKIIVSIPEKNKQDKVIDAIQNDKFDVIIEKSDILNKVQSEKPALVLLDYNAHQDFLTDMSKLENCKNVIMLCDSFDIDLFTKLTEMGAKEVLFTPYDKERVYVLTKVNVHEQSLKYADVMIPYMVEKLVMLGLDRKNLAAKISGGAQMFANVDSEGLKIGKRNIESIRKQLSDNNIKIVSEDVGGNIGRTIRFNVNNQKLSVRTKDKTIEI